MSTIDPAATLNPSIVGQAEKAHSAILYRALAGSTVDEKQWITLNLAVAADATIDRTQLVARVAGAAKFDSTAVEAAIAGLTSVALVQELPGASDQLEVTEAGRALVERVRGATGQIVSRAYGDIPPKDLATTARVLTAITVKLSEELAEN